MAAFNWAGKLYEFGIGNAEVGKAIKERLKVKGQRLKAMIMFEPNLLMVAFVLKFIKIVSSCAVRYVMDEM